MARPRTFDEADVIARARVAFAETGFAGTSLDALLEATGLARQSLYNAFGGKKELFMRAFLSDAAEAVDAVESIRHGSHSPLTRIRAQLVKVAVEHGSAQAPPSLFTKAAVELSARDPEVASTVAAAFETMQTHYARLHRRGPGGRRDRGRRPTRTRSGRSSAPSSRACPPWAGRVCPARRSSTSGSPAWQPSRSPIWAATISAPTTATGAEVSRARTREPPHRLTGSGGQPAQVRREEAPAGRVPPGIGRSGLGEHRAEHDHVVRSHVGPQRPVRDAAVDDPLHHAVHLRPQCPRCSSR